MRVHFYVEANPIRAKFRTLENLKSYVYSSYGFYAYGKKTKFTHLLTIPEWYLQLGKTAQERQTKYRKLFREYVNKYNPNISQIYKKVFIGTEIWILESKARIKKLLTLIDQSFNEAEVGEYAAVNNST